MKHPLSCVAAGFALAALVLTPAFGQDAKPPLSFDVASVKPSPPLDPAKILAGQIHIGMSIEPTRIDFGYTSLMALICTAYKVKTHQVTGPQWINTTMFDIVARLPEGSNKDQVPEMLQTLLAERFKFTFHKETKDHAEYALTVAKGGAKLKDAEPDPAENAPPSKADEGATNMTIPTPDGPVKMVIRKDGSGSQSGPGVNMSYGMKDGAMYIDASKISMKTLCEFISRFTDKPVFDKTELTGSYQLTMHFSMEELMAMARNSGMMGAAGVPASTATEATDPSGSSIFAMMAQYGLKLVPQKTPTDFIIIDHIEKTATEN